MSFYFWKGILAVIHEQKRCLILCCSKEGRHPAHEWVNVKSLSSVKGGALEKGDAAYELDLFPFLPVILCFWDSDDEFPASLQILVDKNILDYMHYETLMFAISHLLNRVKWKV